MTFLPSWTLAVAADTTTTQTRPQAPAITVTPDEIVVGVGLTLSLTATVVNALGDPVSSPTVTWVSSDTSKATVSSSGVVTGVATGPVTITASYVGAAPVKITGYVYVPISPGSSWTTATTNNPAGTHFLGLAGTHKNQQVTPKDNNVYYLADGCVMDGSDVDGVTPITNYAFLPSTSVLGTPVNVQIRGSGKWGSCGRIQYYKAGAASASTDPSKGVIYGASGTTAYGIGWTVDGIEVCRCWGRGIQVSANWTVQRCWIHHIQAMGISDGGLTGNSATFPHDTFITDNLIEDINYQNLFIQGGGPAGLKFAIHTRATIKRNTVQRVNGEGIWGDIDCEHWVVGGAPGDGNVVRDVYDHGIMYEESRYADISYNTVVGCGLHRSYPESPAGWGPVGEGRGCAIFLSTSSDAEVHHNYVDLTPDLALAGTPKSGFYAHGITVFEENRTDAIQDATLWTDFGGTGSQTRKARNNFIHHNQIVAFAPGNYRCMSASTTQTGGDVTSTTANNRWVGNQYRVDSRAQWRWNATICSDFATWQSQRTTAGWELDLSPDAFVVVRGGTIRVRAGTEGIEQYLTVPVPMGVKALGNMGSAATIDATSGDLLVTGTLNSASCTVTINNAYAGARLTLILTQDATGGRAVVLPGKTGTVTPSAASKVDKWLGDYDGTQWVWNLRQGM